MLPWAGSDGPERRRVVLDAALAALPADQIAPWGPTTVRTSAALAGCLDWPGAPFAAAPPGALPDVPTLVLNGLDDVRTPIEDAEAVARLLPRLGDAGASFVALDELVGEVRMSIPA